MERGDEAGCCPLGSAEHFPEILRHCRKVVISMSCIVFGSSPAPSPSKKFKLWFDPFAVQVASSIQEVQRQAKRCANKFANCSLSLTFCLTASGESQGLPPLERPQCSTKAQGRCFLPPIHSQILARATLCFGYCSFANHLARKPNVVSINRYLRQRQQTTKRKETMHAHVPARLLKHNVKHYAG